jgi:hypothetical protein
MSGGVREEDHQLYKQVSGLDSGHVTTLFTGSLLTALRGELKRGVRP